MIYATGETPPPSNPLPTVDASPIVVWVTIGTVVLVLVARSLASAAPNVSEALTRIRTHRQAAEDAKVRDLSSSVDHLAGRVYTLEQRSQRQDRYLYEHAQWDRQVLQAAIEAGLDVDTLGMPPPLWPPPE